MKKSNKHPLRENYERYFGGLGTGFQNNRKTEATRKSELKELSHEDFNALYNQGNDEKEDVAFEELADLIHTASIPWANKWEKIFGDEWEDFLDYEVRERKLDDII